MTRKEVKTMINLRKERSLLELLTGILVSGGVFGLAGLLFLFWGKGVSIAKYETGLWMGVVLSLILAILMWRSLNKAFCLSEKDAAKVMVGSYLTRYIITGVFLVALHYSGKGYILAGFLGIMSIKTGAYLQPLLHRFYNFIFHETDPVPMPLTEEETGSEESQNNSEEVRV